MFRTVSFILLLIMLFSCQKTDDENYAVAQVNDEVLLIEDLKANFSQQQWNDMTKIQKEEIVQDWIRLTMLAQEAKNTGIAEQQAIKNKIETAEKNILANAVIAQKLAEVTVNDEDMFNYYRMHKSNYQKTHKEYKVQRIFVQNEALLDSVRAAISQTTFKEAAIKYSQESAGSNGGYLGFVSQRDIPANQWNVLTKLKKYHYQSLESEEGFYVIRYYDKRDVKTEKTFVEVEDEIRSTLIEMKKQEAFDNLIEDLKIKSEITISL
ncbi:MAG: peptidyl-prolyl cis-trans isomerase [Candidatus Cloacimonetes bacterium]|nr:peptidyl-prolyl cis-trans isomerase [Candidatus Cloacimonadota bacterium]MCF7868414.1 peptidyl-prolyl cis-trans isomerase [Candidatus Cloacimonadota bacterium]MCF7883887.1 peptidyl-prolyl cis-trans isomerase [Candidatus Cloacimonadota bacterium]